MKTFKIIAAILICWSLCAVTTFAETQTGIKTHQPSYPKLIEPDKLKADLDFILKNIDEIHPNMYAYISKEEFNALKIETYEKLNKPLSDLEYYIAIAPLGDKKDGRGVVPDYEVYQKQQDTEKGVDTVLQFTLNLMKESNSKGDL